MQKYVGGICTNDNTTFQKAANFLYELSSYCLQKPCSSIIIRYFLPKSNNIGVSEFRKDEPRHGLKKS